MKKKTPEQEKAQGAIDAFLAFSATSMKQQLAEKGYTGETGRLEPRCYLARLLGRLMHRAGLETPCPSGWVEAHSPTARRGPYSAILVHALRTGWDEEDRVEPGRG